MQMELSDEDADIILMTLYQSKEYYYGMSELPIADYGKVAIQEMIQRIIRTERKIKNGKMQGRQPSIPASQIG